MKQVSLAITHYNRFPLLRECMEKVMGDDRIGEIVIVDDCSTDDSFHHLAGLADHCSKIRLRRNHQNLDCYRNKREAVFYSSNDWVILFDSDNVIDPSYLDSIFAIPDWIPTRFYLPVQAKPFFDYRAFSNAVVCRSNVRTFLERPHFTTALNTANYLVPKKGYLETFDPSTDPHTSDSIYMAYRWLARGGRLHFVPGLSYFHRVHDQSHFKTNHHKTGHFGKQVIQGLRDLR